MIYQPKFLLRCTLSKSKYPQAHIDMVWDPLLEALEAIPCPACQRPTFSLALERDGSVWCSCQGTWTPARR